jgi:glutaredoxin
VHGFSFEILSRAFRVTSYNPLMTRVIIYSKPGCHLCEEAKAAIQAAGCGEEYVLEEVNIETDPELLRRYRFEIPVITIDGVEAFKNRVSSEEFKKAIRSAKNS